MSGINEYPSLHNSERPLKQISQCLCSGAKYKQPFILSPHIMSEQSSCSIDRQVQILPFIATTATTQSTVRLSHKQDRLDHARLFA